MTFSVASFSSRLSFGALFGRRAAKSSDAPPRAAPRAAPPSASRDRVDARSRYAARSAAYDATAGRALAEETATIDAFVKALGRRGETGAALARQRSATLEANVAARLRNLGSDAALARVAAADAASSRASLALRQGLYEKARGEARALGELSGVRYGTPAYAAAEARARGHLRTTPGDRDVQSLRDRAVAARRDAAAVRRDVGTPEARERAALSEIATRLALLRAPSPPRRRADA